MNHHNKPVSLTPLETYLFDLQGFLVLKNAVDASHLREMNAILDSMSARENGEWCGWVRVERHGTGAGGSCGRVFLQIYEAGEPFERLIDHPSWIEKVRTFVGGEGTFDYLHGPLFIDENFASLRGPGEALNLHSGGHTGVKRTQYRFYNGKFQCGQINILLALHDIGPGDGATMVIPGSHKANFVHPEYDSKEISAEHLTGAQEVFLKAGDAILFVDALAHGASKRVNPDFRRIAVYRYGPSWGFFRQPFRPSPELVARLTPERRKIVWPHAHALYPPGVKPLA